MIKSFAALSVTTGARLLTGLILFVLLAREWSAAAFGQFMYLFSIAALLVLACEFGFTQQILREIGRAPSDAAKLMGRYLGAKLWLTAATWCGGLLFAWITNLSWQDIALLTFLLAAGSLMSFGDFFMACFRAMGNFSEEAWLSLGGNLLLFALALFAVCVSAGPVGVAIAMAAARLVQFVLSYLTFRRGVTERLKPTFGLSATATTIRSSSAYGADVAIGAAFVNVDTVLIAHTLGPESVGIYQAIARIYQGATQIPAILGSIFLPKLSRDLGNKHQFDKHCKLLAMILLGSGLLGALTLGYGRPALESVYVEAHLKRALDLLPWFGLLLFVRFTASIYGITLTALGKQPIRVFIYATALAAMALTATPLMLHFGEAGMVMACVISYIILTTMFAIGSAYNGQTPQGWWVALIITISLSVFSLWKTGIHP